MSEKALPIHLSSNAIDAIAEYDAKCILTIIEKSISRYLKRHKALTLYDIKLGFEYISKEHYFKVFFLPYFLKNEILLHPKKSKQIMRRFMGSKEITCKKVREIAIKKGYSIKVIDGTDWFYTPLSSGTVCSNISFLKPST